MHYCKIRNSRNGKITLMFINLGQSCLNHEFLTSKVCFWLLSGSPGLSVGLFGSSIQFYVLLSPFLCFISLLYLDVCVLGDDVLII